MNKQEDIKKLSRPELNEDDPATRELFKLYLETLLFKHKFVNKGNHGIIGSVDLAELDPKLASLFIKKELAKEGLERPEKVAVKMLKVYSDVNLAKKEGDIHEASRKVLEESGVEGISIPAVYVHDQVEISDDNLRTRLIEEGVDANNPVGVILMDFVKGEDMATYLYKNVIKRDEVFRRDFLATFNPGKELSDQAVEETLQTVNFEDLQLFIQDRLGFEKAGGKHEDESLKAFEQKKVQIANFKKIIKSLQKNNFIFDSRVLDKIKEATDILHKKGIYHRDLHERNIMFSYDEEGNINHIYIIDFGSAEEVESKMDNPYEYNYGEAEYVHDDYVYKTYTPTLTKLSSIKDQEKFFEKTYLSLNKIKNNKARSEALKKVQNNIKEILVNGEEIEEVIDAIKNEINDFSDKQISPDVSVEDNWDLRLSLWDEVIENNQNFKEAILKYLGNLIVNDRALKVRRLPIPVTNSLDNFIRYKK